MQDFRELKELPRAFLVSGHSVSKTPRIANGCAAFIPFLLVASPSFKSIELIGTYKMKRGEGDGRRRTLLHFQTAHKVTNFVSVDLQRTDCIFWKHELV